MLKNFKFTTKLFLSYSIVGITLVSIIFTVFYIYMRDNTLKNSGKNFSELCQKTTSQVDNLINDLDKTALFIVSNPFINEFLKTDGQAQNAGSGQNSNEFEKMNMLKQMIMVANVPRSNASIRISIYNLNNLFISSGYPDDPDVVEKQLKSPKFKKWYSDLNLMQNRIILYPHDDFWSNNKGFRPLSLIRGIYNLYTYEQYGVIEVQAPFRKLEGLLKLNDNKDIVSLLVDGHGNPIYISDEAKAPKALAASYFKKIDGKREGSIMLENPSTHKKEMMVFNRSDVSDWTFILSVPESSLLKAIKFTGMIYLFTALCIILLTMLTIFLISRRMAKPLNLLKDSVVNVNLNNLSISLPHESGNNEISQLNEAFTAMFKRLEESMEELVIIRSHEMQAHKIALQAQIDPHFIYNTFSLITAFSRESNADKVIEVSSRFSGMLRYITSYEEDIVALDKELSHAENYLALMKLRYEDQFEYSFEIEEIIPKGSIRIPKLTLQPLVENCFQHGFKGTLPPWHITIRAYTREQLYFIEIEDNGIGMSEEFISGIYKRAHEFSQNPSENIKNLKLGGMGLINTFVRLQLLNKNELVLNIEKGQQGGRGCKIIIGGTLNDKDNDC